MSYKLLDPNNCHRALLEQFPVKFDSENLKRMKFCEVQSLLDATKKRSDRMVQRTFSAKLSRDWKPEFLSRNLSTSAITPL